MRRHLLITIVALTGVSMIAFMVGSSRSKEPAHQRNSLSEWLQRLDDPSLESEQVVGEAIWKMGTNALPLLVSKLRSSGRDSKFRSIVRTVVGQQRFLNVRVRSASERDGTRRYQVERAFRLLGKEAGPSAPALVTLLKQGDFDESDAAARALAAIGEPALLQLVQNLESQPPGSSRVRILRTIGQFGQRGAIAVSVLLSFLDDSDRSTRCMAAKSLGRIRAEPEVVVPALVALLQDERCIYEAVEALGEYGPEANAALAPLQGLLSKSSEDLRQRIIKAIDKIDSKRLKAETQ